MHVLDAIQSALTCPNCAGQRVFDPGGHGLICQSCGTAEPIDVPEDHDADRETVFDPNAPAEETPQTARTRTHQCETCGGAVVFTGPALSERCPYCDGPVALGPLDQGYETMGLIPFGVTDAFAQRRALDWVRARWAAPNDLGRVVAKGRVAGLFAPFWTFDSREAIQYWAKYRVRSGKKTRVHSTSGHLTMHFDDLLVPASPHVTPLIRDGILHDFHPATLVPYDVRYLSGFAAERHHQSVQEGLDANADDKRVLIRNRIKRHIDKSGVHDIRYQTDTTGIRYRRLLLPVWILHYSYRGKPMKVVVSGIDGRTFGERPFSIAKLAGLAAGLAAAVIAFGWLWGAAGGL